MLYVVRCLLPRMFENGEKIQRYFRFIQNDSFVGNIKKEIHSKNTIIIIISQFNHIRNYTKTLKQLVNKSFILILDLYSRLNF